MVYHCFYCKIENKSKVFYKKTEAQNHWFIEHNQTQRFQFYAGETAICCCCGEVGTFEELTTHHSQMHPNEVFVILNGANKETCALCNYHGKQMNIHSKVMHRDQSVFNPVRMSIASLQQLHITINEIENFYCCQQLIDPSDLLKHMQNHGRLCSICNNYETIDMVDMLMHIRSVHSEDKIDPHLKTFRKKLKKEFYNTAIIFANGVVLFNCNLIGTEFDVIEDFDGFVGDWIQNLKSDFQKEIEKECILKVIIPYIDGENIKMIFGNLCRMLGVQINHSDIVKIERTASKRDLSIECRSPDVKKDLMKRSSTTRISVSDLIDSASTYMFPPNMNFSVTFE